MIPPVFLLFDDHASCDELEHGLDCLCPCHAIRSFGAGDQVQCGAFLLCDHPAVGWLYLPALGRVTACQRCADRYERLAAAS